MRYFFFAFLVAVISAVVILGYRGQKTERRPFEIFNDMDHQAKFKSQSESRFYADGRADRAPIPGTIPASVPVGNDPAGSYYATGLINGTFGDGIPIPVDMKLLQRGQERYTINCAVCHGASGGGNGIVSEYGFGGIANYHTDPIRRMPDGQIYYTIVHGKNTMLGLPHIAPDDRWAIVAYVRALQRSQQGTLADVPQSEREKLTP